MSINEPICVNPNSAVLLALISQYMYAIANPIRLTDPSGLQPTPEQVADTARACRNWHAREVRDMDWLLDLPYCPCCLVSADCNPNFLPPEPAYQEYHPGAAVCIRSRPSVPLRPGQQCCYSAAGPLITVGPGAGTPDRVNPGGVAEDVLHTLEDIAPFHACKLASLLDLYFQVRPPNNGIGCESWLT